MEKEYLNYWLEIKDNFIQEDSTINFDSLKKYIYFLKQLGEDYQNLVKVVTFGAFQSLNNVTYEDVIKEFEKQLSTKTGNINIDLDLDFAESTEWVQWVKDNENTNSVTKDEIMIMKYHLSLFNYIQKYDESIKFIESLKDLTSAKKINKEIEKFLLSI